MTVEGIPDDVRELIARHIDSVGKLELILLLGARSPLSAETAAGELLMAAEPVRERLDELVKARLATRRGEEYSLRSADLLPLVERLADAYNKRRVTVVELVFNRPNESLSAFADAFKFRRKK